MFYFGMSAINMLHLGYQMDLKSALESFAEEIKSLRHSREEVSGEAVLSIPGIKPPLVGGAVNLSVGGVGVLLGPSAPLLDAGAGAQITLHWPDGDAVTVEANIAWQGPKDTEGASYGLVFRDLEDDQLEHINRHLISSVVDRHLSDE
jgi:hypothetical protein